MSTIDRILDVLDVGLQHSTECGYPVPPAPGDIDYCPNEATIRLPHSTVPRPPPSRIYRVWHDRIASGRFTKSECAQFTHSAVRMAQSHSPKGKRTNLTPWEAVDLVEALRSRGGVTLTDDHTAQGLAWLERHGAKVLGWTRGQHEHVLSDFSHFTYQGEAVVDGSHGQTTLPIWRVHLRCGTVLSYYNAAWQSQAWDGSPVQSAWWWVSGPTLAS